MHGVEAVGVQGCAVGKFHDAAQLVILTAGRKIVSNPSLQQTGNLALKSANFRGCSLFLIFCDTWLPAVLLS
jgi:hypothetical protein